MHSLRIPSFAASASVSLALLLGAACGDDSAVGETQGTTTDDATSEVSGTESATSGGELTTGETSTGSESGTGTDTDDTTSTGEPADCDAAPADADVQGRIYTDVDGSDQSTYVGGFEEGIDAPIAGAVVSLISADQTQTVKTCDDGRYGFAGLEEGVHLVAAEPTKGSCTQRNCTHRLPVAIEGGHVTMLTIGDSVPVQGDAVTFPARVATLLSELATIDNMNEAVSGSKSTQWVPGASYFEQRVRPNLAQTDLVVISVGGNDFLELMGSATLDNIVQVLADAEILVADIAENVRMIESEIHAEKADIDVVYCVYVDYSLASNTSPWDLANFLPEGTIHDLLVQARDLIEPDDDIIIVDLLEVSKELSMPLDNYLADALHFNDLGHTLYAEEVFKALGGVLIGPSPLTGAPNTPLGEEHSYGYGP